MGKVPSILLLMIAGAAWAAGPPEPDVAEASPEIASGASAFEATPAPSLDYYAQEPAQIDTPPKPKGRSNIDLEKVGQEMRAARGQPASPEPDTAAPPKESLSYLKAASALLLVLGLIAVLSYALRRFGGRTQLLKGMQLGQVMGRIYLSPKATLHFVRTGGRVLVVAITPAHISLVAEFDAAAFEQEVQQESPPAADESARGFARLLSLIRSRTAETSAENERLGAEESIAALRADILRLQEYIKDMSRSGSKS